MKCAIIYLSGTGNTEKVALSIQAGIKKAAGSCDIFKFKDADPYGFGGYDLIGMGSPVWGMFRAPDVIKDYIEKMRFIEGKHIFAFNTHGTFGDGYFPSIVPMLQNKGFIVVGTFECYGACYGSGMPDPFPTNGHPDAIDLQEAEEFGEEIVERSRRISNGEADLIPPVPKLEIPEDISLLKEIYENDKDQTKRKKKKPLIVYNAEICNYPKCGLCMDVCPVNAIDLTVKPPIIADPCPNCGEMCVKVCPTGAMAVKPEELEFMAKHAKDSLDILYYPAIDKAEAEGRFRRLVPKEKVGVNTPFYKTHNKHPQWKIGKGPI